MLGGAVAALLVLALAAAFGIAWYFAGVAVAVSHVVQRTVVADPVGAGSVHLTADPDAVRAGTFGLDWQDGYGRLGAVRGRDSTGVVRDLTTLHGTLTAGAKARIDTYAYDGDPRSALGLVFEDVKVHDALGDFPAWYVPAARTDRSWFVFVHGHDGSRAESLRYLRALHRAGMPVLVPTFRNDVGAPASPDGGSAIQTSPPDQS